MRQLDKSHENIDAKLMEQLARIASELYAYSNHFRTNSVKNHGRKINQWVVATPLKITKTEQGKFILEKEVVDQRNEVYLNIFYNKKNGNANCDSTCINKLNTLKTRIKPEIKNKNSIHTEIQMMYKHTKSILKEEKYKNRIILVYSTFIPCSQNQFANGGVFLECAGEMAKFVADKSANKGNNRFIVFYETVHKDGDTVIPVSQLYMELSGIIALKYQPQEKKLTRDERHLPHFTNSFRKKPTFLQLGRPLLNDNFKVTATQLFVDCLARNSFVVLRSELEDVQKVQFIIAKYQLYRAFSMDAKKLGELLEAALNNKDLKNQQKMYILACHKFAEAMSEDPVKSRIIVPTKETDYLSYDFVGMPLTPKVNFQREKLTFSENADKRTCDEFLPKFRQHFNIKESDRLKCKLQ